MATTYGGQLRSRYSPDHIVAKAIVVRKSVGGNTVPVQVRPRLLCKNKITQLVERLLPVRGFESHFYFYKMEDKRTVSRLGANELPPKKGCGFESHVFR